MMFAEGRDQIAPSVAGDNTECSSEVVVVVRDAEPPVAALRNSKLS